MDITTENAKETLAVVNKVTEATRLAAAMAGADTIVMAWGTIWFAGFLWNHLVLTMAWPDWWHGIWLPLIAAGVLITLLIAKRRDAPVKNPGNKRIGFFWWAMYGYAYLGAAILGPSLNLSLLDATPGGAAKTMGAINAIIPMFAYVVMGLWLEQNYFIYIGLALTAVTCTAYFAFNPVFFLFMAVAGGGLLFGCGLWMRMRWVGARRRLGQHA